MNLEKYLGHMKPSESTDQEKQSTTRNIIKSALSVSF